MLSDAVIILANMRGGYVNVGSTVHTLFRMSGKPRQSRETGQARGEIEAVRSAEAIAG